MGRVLSQGEIDNLLTGLLQDATVLPDSGGGSAESVGAPAQEAVPVGLAAFKAKIEAAKKAAGGA